MRTSIACPRTRLRGSTAPLRQDFARRIEPDTGERQAKSQGERGQGLTRGHRREPAFYLTPDPSQGDIAARRFCIPALTRAGLSWSLAALGMNLLLRSSRLHGKSSDIGRNSRPSMSANGAECRGIPRSSPKGAVAATARAVALKGRKARVRPARAAASFVTRHQATTARPMTCSISCSFPARSLLHRLAKSRKCRAAMSPYEAPSPSPPAISLTFRPYQARCGARNPGGEGRSTTACICADKQSPSALMRCTRKRMRRTKVPNRPTAGSK
jgi:hypothetical protein